MKRKSILAPVLRIVIPYLLLGAAWILFSDRLLLSAIDDPGRLMFLSTAKGWLYVLITGLLLLILVYGELRRQASLEAMLRKGLAEKDELLSELNHRVMNNLQVITSILDLEAESSTDRESMEANARTMARIRAMAIAQVRLYEDGTYGMMDLGAYLRELWGSLRELFPDRDARVSFDLIEVRCGPDKAVSFGLIAAEAITNALRFGAGPGGRADVAIRLAEGEGGQLEFWVLDGGPGMQEAVPGLGFKLMDALASQLGGAVGRSGEAGTRVLLKFPRPENPNA